MNSLFRHFPYRSAATFATLLGLITSPLSGQGLVVKSTGTFTAPAVGWATTGIIKIVAAVKSAAYQQLPIVFTRNVSGVVADNALAEALGSGSTYDPLDAQGGLGMYLTQSNILTAGNPATVSGPLNASPAAAVSGLGLFSAASSATITPGLQVNAKGEIQSASALTKTAVNANAAAISYFAAFGDAFSTAAAGTDPFVFAPLTSDAILDLHIDLDPNFADDPNARFGMQAFTNNPGVSYGTYDFNYDITSNLPDDENLLSLSFHVDTNHGTVTVGFSSDIPGLDAAPPIVPADFVSPVAGDYFLAPAASQFDLDVAVPSGILGRDQDGPVGLVLNVDQSARAFVTGVPETSPWVMAVFALAATCILGRRFSYAQRWA